MGKAVLGQFLTTLLLLCLATLTPALHADRHVSLINKIVYQLFLENEVASTYQIDAGLHTRKM